MVTYENDCTCIMCGKPIPDGEKTCSVECCLDHDAKVAQEAAIAEIGDYIDDMAKEFDTTK